jgi:hypothetical protein
MEDNITTDLKERGCKGILCINCFKIENSGRLLWTRLYNYGYQKDWGIIDWLSCHQLLKKILLPWNYSMKKSKKKK